MDIKGAYLNCGLGDTEILMRIDPMTAAVLCFLCPNYRHFLSDGGALVVRLRKALYGCVEASRLWYENLKECFATAGFVPNPMDQCVFNKGQGRDQTTVVIYVDDIFVTAYRQEGIDEVARILRERYSGVSVHDGPVHSYLGMSFDFSTDFRVKVTMKGYIENLLEGCGVMGTASSPATEHLFRVRESDALPEEDRIEFHSRVAKVLYLAKRVRPEMLPAAVFLATRVKEPTRDDWCKLDRLLRYLNGSRDLGIVLLADEGIAGCVHAYIDASYGVHADAKSHTGTLITLGKGPVFVKSAKQKVVSKSSTEAELIGLSDGASQVLWMREFLIAQGYQVRAAKIYQDNMSTIKLTEKGRSSSERTRHINIRYFFVKDRVDSGEVMIEYMPTGDMLADILTKPLQGEEFRAMRRRLLNWE